jgi:hypothetical protein
MPSQAFVGGEKTSEEQKVMREIGCDMWGRRRVSRREVAVE